MTAQIVDADSQEQSVDGRARGRRKSSAGRTAKTKGVSLSPNELDDVKIIEELGGVGLSEVYHRHFAPQMHAAAQMLLSAREAGVQLNRHLILDGWDVSMTSGELAAIYEAPSTLVMGE